MKRIAVSFCYFLALMQARANDGAFRANGNQLIPIAETDVSVKKEILTVRRINSRQALVDVYYEFFSPKDTKTIEVGLKHFLLPAMPIIPQMPKGTGPILQMFRRRVNSPGKNGTGG